MKKSSIKNIIIVVAVVIVLFVLYTIFLKPNAQKSQGTLTSSQTGVSPTIPIASEQDAGGDLLRLLTSLEGLELNDSIFFNPAFDALHDIGIPLVKEGNPGRRNPFAPIGTDPIPAPVNNGTVDGGNTDQTPGDGGGFGIFGEESS